MFCTAASAARIAFTGSGSAALRARVTPLASRKATSGGGLGSVHQRRLLSEKAKQETTDAAAKDTAASANKAKAEAPPAAAEEKKGGGGWWTSAEFWGGLGALAGWGSELQLCDEHRNCP
jgi:hypothetical protein